MGTRIIAIYCVAVVLLLLLILRIPINPRAVQRIGFFLGLAALVFFLVPWPGRPDMEWMVIDIGKGRFAYAGAWLVALVPLAPFVVLIETGIAGYRGFSSFFRYAALSLVVLGLAGVVASLVIPRLIRR
jgi:hypothetical protein